VNELIQDVDHEADPITGSDPYAGMMDTARNRFAEFTSNPASAPPQSGLSIPDIYATPQQMFRDRMHEVSDRGRANELRRVRRERLLQHIRSNILHYCRAIWAEEDREQRLLRYRKEGRTVPVEWVTDISYANGAIVNNGWHPSGVTAPLVDVIDPLGPLGYVGNYSVWALKPTGKAPRLRMEGSFNLFPLPGGGYNPSPPGPAPRMVADLAAVLLLSKGPYLDTTTGELLDPALKGFRTQADALAAGYLGNLTDDQVFDMVSYLPDLRESLLTNDAPPKVRRDQTTGTLVNAPTARQWANYLYRRNGTRRILVDSDNLYLSLRVGEGAALEPFKRAHRYIDVMRAVEDVEAERLRNKRREGMLTDPGAFDPDIQKVVVVGGGVTAGDIAGPQTITNNPSAPDPVND
jgi:hypothetical protein